MKWTRPYYSENAAEAATDKHKYVIIESNGQAELTVFAYDRRRSFGRRKLSTTRHKSMKEAQKAAERHAKTHG